MFKWFINQNKAYWKEAKQNIVPTLIMAIVVAIVAAITGIDYMTITVWFVFACCGIAFATVIYISVIMLYRHIVKSRNKFNGGKNDEGNL